MSIPLRLRERFRDSTEATPEQVERQVRRIREQIEARSAADLLRWLPGPADPAVEEVVHRVSSSLSSKTQGRPGIVAQRAVLLAATVILVVLLGRSFQGEDRPDRPLSATYPSTEHLVVEPTPFVRFEMDGQGVLSGTENAPLLGWQIGNLVAHVEPDRAIDLIVETDEARVRVRGTTFHVRRSALGTHVLVVEGHVEVTCGTKTPVLLDPGAQTECLPRRPGGLLTRARLLDGEGLSDAAIASASLGLALAPSGDPARGELLALRAMLLDKAGDAQAARDDAWTYLDEAHAPRAEAMKQLMRKTEVKP